ncbi:MAG TPA: hypothetical protein VLU91_03085 [Nitrososphaerales archaeon]|nr:hypothetical protein [Nitrososphaerales archaeon]
MSATRWVVLFLLLFGIALFVPFIPQTQNSGHLAGVQYQQTAIVSPSYYVSHCGAYVDMQLTAQIGSHIAGNYQPSRGYTFTCNYSSQ